MYYVITPNTQGEKPYGFYKFSSLKLAHGSNVVDEHSMVFSSAEQLAENFTIDEINGVIAVVDKPSVVKNIKISAKQLFDITTEKAVTFKPIESSPKEGKVKEEVVEKVVTKKTKSAPTPRTTSNAKIKVLKPFEGNPNSTRGLNLAIIVKSETSEAAVAGMVKSGVDQKVARSFVRWAASQGYIELIGA
jgi:hypothetical protein